MKFRWGWRAWSAAAVAFAGLVSAAPAAAQVRFINKTGQAVNDFRINLRGTGGALPATNSIPWGMGMIDFGGSGQMWAGAAINHGQSLLVLGWKRGAKLPGERWPTIEHPMLGDLFIDTAYWTKDGKQVGAASPRHVMVPEPAAWAMMIVGFGLGGAVLRRRRALPGTA
ncbi:MAG: PEPxxWA-CTERM sorting domain-containing protein [Sphingomonadaceae bacterium]|nr:PEPxxWA-CTERM sorting domain-containing protein [Thermaurantiacus sp.]MCS6987337.1 PEPxxWA-CTERM sorting domain-containing protein [Sphingomonadaceae bacterium]MDW8414558.1 PEPxxWA-CTERM sorting domain-containing protein [Thermaurantiacus sp.]